MNKFSNSPLKFISDIGTLQSNYKHSISQTANYEFFVFYKWKLHRKFSQTHNEIIPCQVLHFTCFIFFVGMTVSSKLQNIFEMQGNQNHVSSALWQHAKPFHKYLFTLEIICYTRYIFQLVPIIEVKNTLLLLN